MERSAGLAEQYRSTPHKSEMLSQLMKLLTMANSKLTPIAYLRTKSNDDCFVDLYHEYHRIMKVESKMLFLDLVHNAYTIMRSHPDIAIALQHRYAHVLVDEYQDTNEIQNALLLQIASKGCVSIVGDIDQVCITSSLS